MNFSRSYRIALNGIIKPSRGNSYIKCIELNKAPFHNIFVVDISKDTFIVPLFARSVIEDALKDVSVGYLTIDKLVIPLYPGSNMRQRTTTDNIIIDFFNSVSYGHKLQKIVTSKGNIFYGGRGIILDEYYNILFLAALSCTKNVEKNSIDYTEGIIYIHPKVFTDNNDIISGTILKKIIPFYLTYCMDSFYCEDKFRNRMNSSKYKIVIEDVNNFIQNPKIPTFKEDIDDDINQLLIDNLDDLVEQIKLDVI